MAADWHERYLELADRHDSSEGARAEAEREFTRLVTRLCVAVSGLDRALDPHLEGLRRAMKGRGDLIGRLQQANGIADSLLKTAEGRSRPDLLLQLLERGRLSPRQVDETVRLWAAVAADPAQAAAQDLDRLTELLRTGFADGEAGTGARGGLIARLIGRRPGEGGGSPNRLMLDLLQAVDWPDSLQADVSDLRGRLEGNGDNGAWIGVVRELSGLTVRAIDQAQRHARSAESFLNELSQRLEALDRHMLDDVQRRADSHASGERLGRSMSNEVEHLSDSVRQSVDLADLKARVLSSLDRMQAQVREHLDEENLRREQAEEEAGRLRRELNRLERDTFDLRRQVAQTYQEAMRDALTGLPNRRAYDERIAQEVARWRRFAEPLTLLIWDIDDFKRINDEFGHQSGDRALVMIGRLLAERVRETDFIARYGGEEFVVLWTGASLDDAQRLAEGMRDAVEQSGLHAHGRPVRITVSGGLAVFGEGDTAETVFERADRALYQAKRQGKNRVVPG